MKGSYKTLFFMVALIVVTIVFVLGVRFFQSVSERTVADTGTIVQEQLNLIDTAHIVKDCFLGKNYFVDDALLKKHNESKICDFMECSACAIDFTAAIKNRKTGEEWVFPKKVVTEYSIPISIRTADGKVMNGGLYVAI